MRPANILLAVLLASATFTCGAQQGLPPPLVGGPPSEVPVAVQVLRWQMLDNSVSSLMFRSMDSLFTTRTVARSGPVWNLPRQDQPLDFHLYLEGAADRPRPSSSARTPMRCW